jgi:hypothetical protein
MTLIVKSGYLPGFTQAERDPSAEAALIARDLYDNPDGGALLTYALGRLLESEVHLLLSGFDGSPLCTDPRNKIVGSCMKANCMSAIWWMAEREAAEGRWTAYAGSWNEELGVMVLDSPEYHSVPLVWLSEDVPGMRALLKLSRV